MCTQANFFAILEVKQLIDRSLTPSKRLCRWEPVTFADFFQKFVELPVFSDFLLHSSCNNSCSASNAADLLIKDSIVNAASAIYGQEVEWLIQDSSLFGEAILDKLPNGVGVNIDNLGNLLLGVFQQLRKKDHELEQQEHEHQQQQHQQQRAPTAAAAPIRMRVPINSSVCVSVRGSIATLERFQVSLQYILTFAKPGGWVLAAAFSVSLPYACMTCAGLSDVFCFH